MSKILKIKELVGLNDENNVVVTIQFLTQEELDEYKPKAIEQYPNLNFIERDAEVEVSEPKEPVRELTKDDWLNLEQSLFSNSSLLTKALNSKGNGFSFLLKVLTDGKTTGASENTLYLAINTVIQGLTEDITGEELEFINNKLKENNFSIRI